MPIVVDADWCRANKINTRAVCEACRRERFAREAALPEDERARDHEGQERADHSTVYAVLAAWRPGRGLSPRLFCYVCPQGHRTYAEMPVPNGGEAWRAVSKILPSQIPAMVVPA